MNKTVKPPAKADAAPTKTATGSGAASTAKETTTKAAAPQPKAKSPAEAKPAEVKPSTAKPAEAKPATAKPAAVKPPTIVPARIVSPTEKSSSSVLSPNSNTWADVASKASTPVQPQSTAKTAPVVKAQSASSPRPSPVRSSASNSWRAPIFWLLGYLLVVALSAFGPALFAQHKDALQNLVTSVAASASTPSAPNSNAPAATTRANFDLLDLPLSHTFKGGEKLTLRAAGMRKKFFISVYSVGIYFSDKLAAARAGAAKGQRVQAVLANANNEALGLLITFQRDVEVEKIAEAFVSALGSGDAAYLKDKAALQSILLSPSGAYAKGSTIEFTFSGRGRLGTSINKAAARHIESPALRRRLLEVYLGAASVVPEVVETLTH